MLAQFTKSTLRRRLWVVLATVVLLTLAGAASAGDKKNKKNDVKLSGSQEQ